MKKRILSLLLAGVLVLGMTACSNKEEKETEETTTETTTEATTETTTEATTETTTEATTETTTEETTSSAADFKVALVTDTGGIDDKSFNQSTWEGIEKFKEETGAETNYAQSNSDADYIPNLSNFADEEYNLIVAPGFLFETAMAEVATNYPEQSLLIIDTVVPDKANVASAVFAEEQGSFLVGIAAGKAAVAAGKTTVGFVGGMDLPLIQKFEAGFEAGVKAVDANISVLVEYVGDFVDAGKGQSLASKMYDQGAYVVYQAAGSAGNGAIKEAKDRRTSGEDVWVIGVDKDQYADGIYEGEKSAILTSMMKRVDVAAYTVAKLALEGAFPGGEVLTFDLSNAGVSIPEVNPNLSDDVVAEITAYGDKIKSGEIVVPTTPSRIQ